MPYPAALEGSTHCTGTWHLTKILGLFPLTLITLAISLSTRRGNALSDYTFEICLVTSSLYLSWDENSPLFHSRLNFDNRWPTHSLLLIQGLPQAKHSFSNSAHASRAQLAQPRNPGKQTKTSIRLLHLRRPHLHLHLHNVVIAMAT